MIDKLCKMLNFKVLICLYVFVLGSAFVYINQDINATIKELEQEINSNMSQLMGKEGEAYYDVDYLSHETKIEQIDVPKISRFNDIRTLYALDHENNNNGWSIYKIRLKKAWDGEQAIIVSKEFPYAVGYKKYDSFFYTPKSVREIVQSSLEYEQKYIQTGVYNQIIKELNDLTNDAFEIQRKDNSTWSTTGTRLYDEQTTSSDIIYSTYIYTDTYKCFLASSQPICIYKIVMRNDNMLKILGMRALKAFAIITICFIIFHIIVNNIKGNGKSEKIQFGRFVNDLCNPKGRISRFEYLTYIFLIFGTFGLTSFLKYNSGLFNALDNSSTVILMIGIMALFLVCFIMILAFVCQSTRRCHDLNKSGWFQFIPLYHLWLLFAKGDEGSNQYDVSDRPEEKQTQKNTTSPKTKKNVLLLVCAALGIALVVTLLMLFKGSDAHNSLTSPQPDIHEQSKEFVQSHDAQQNNNGQQNTNTQSSNNVQPDNKTQTNDNEPTNTDAQPNIPGDYPDASIRVLTASELGEYSKRELKLMRNEIFARHGYIFKTDDMKNHFSSKQWYEPKYNDVNNMLTDIEQQNIKTIQQLEK